MCYIKYMKNKKCFICKKVFYKQLSHSNKYWDHRTTCSNKCRAIYNGLNNRGTNNSNWKGGTITFQGYKCLSINGKRILEHRYIMEQYIGRKLDRKEHVHHINENKLDNRIENLKLLSIVDHFKLHYPKGSKFGIHNPK